MKIHKEGKTIIVVSFLIIAGIMSVFFLFTPTILAWILLPIAIVFFILIVRFFRVPNRNPSFGENNILAPSDGKIVNIQLKI